MDRARRQGYVQKRVGLGESRCELVEEGGPCWAARGDLIAKHSLRRTHHGSSPFTPVTTPVTTLVAILVTILVIKLVAIPVATRVTKLVIIPVQWPY